jgi:hypothetical protein
VRAALTQYSTYYHTHYYHTHSFTHLHIIYKRVMLSNKDFLGLLEGGGGKEKFDLSK